MVESKQLILRVKRDIAPNALNNVHVWGFLGLLLQFVMYITFLILLYAKNMLGWVRYYDSIVLAVGSLLAFGVLAFGHKETCEEKKQARASTANDLEREAVKILSSMYAVIAGLSLTTAIKELSSLKDVFVGLEPIIIFFSIALPFYNGATMFLVRNYYSQGFEGRRREPLFDFFMLFAEAISLYGMAINITQPFGFIVSFLFLLFFDATWVLYILGRKWRKEAPREWLWLDFYMFTLFLFWFLTRPYMWALVIVAIFRTFTDYYVALPFYLP